MKILLKCLLAVVVLVGAVFLYAQTLPDNFVITRSTRINATPETVFPLINNLHNFNLWNPFAKQDPTTKISYSGTETGNGSRFDWEGSGSAGKGSLEIIHSTSPSNIQMLLHILTPMEAKNNVEFTVAPSNNHTEVSWTMSGEARCMNKFFGLIFNMDKMVGGEFEKGLADLKLLAEKPAA